MKGTVKWFDMRKRFGYIVDEEGKEVFVHVSGITDGRTYVGLNPGDEVEFDVVEGKKGPQADKVSLTEK